MKLKWWEVRTTIGNGKDPPVPENIRYELYALAKVFMRWCFLEYIVFPRC
jgi:hypothetical protein